MEPIIYPLPKISIDNYQYVFDIHPCPKLIKFGFNNINYKFDLVELTANQHYKNGLNFNFDSNDSFGIVTKAKNIFNMEIDEIFAEFWELILLFQLFKNNQNIITSHEREMKNIISLYSKLLNTSNKYSIVKASASLIIYKFSIVDVDENSYVKLLMKHRNIFDLIDKGGNMIIQIFNIQTAVMAEIVGLLSSYFRESYIVKPQISSDLSDSKYIVLLDCQKKPNIEEPKSNEYIISLGINLTEDFVNIIQCLNSTIIPLKYIKYQEIKKYLDSKIYTGATYQEFIDKQNKYAEKWIQNYSNLGNIPDLFKEQVDKYNKSCVKYSDIFDKLFDKL